MKESFCSDVLHWMQSDVVTANTIAAGTVIKVKNSIIFTHSGCTAVVRSILTHNQLELSELKQNHFTYWLEYWCGVQFQIYSTHWIPFSEWICTYIKCMEVCCHDDNNYDSIESYIHPFHSCSVSFHCILLIILRKWIHWNYPMTFICCEWMICVTRWITQTKCK